MRAPTLTERHAALLAYQDAKREIDRAATERRRADAYRCTERRSQNDEHECFCGGGCMDWNF